MLSIDGYFTEEKSCQLQFYRCWRLPTLAADTIKSLRQIHYLLVSGNQTKITKFID